MLPFKSYFIQIVFLLQLSNPAFAVPVLEDRDVGDFFSFVSSKLLQATPTATPSSVPDALSVMSSAAVKATDSPGLVEQAFDLIENGLVDLGLFDPDTAFNDGNNLVIPNNPDPPTTIYPQASSSDPPYDVSEAELRKAIKIPTGFTYGQKPPVILIPGTSSTGYLAFKDNFIPLLTDYPHGDPVWLNIPNFILGDAQVSAEYIAYAVNYISSISSSSSEIALITWSQGSLLVQWALKYWASTRPHVANFIALSPDFHGTKLAYLLCNGTPLIFGCTPSIFQQTYDSRFVKALRAGGGDSAYVHTTTLFSSSDEIVQPQIGSGASGFLLDARGAGVTNVQLQDVCDIRPGGGFVTHEGVLATSLAWALASDVLINGGPANLDRIDIDTVCGQFIAPGLTKESLADQLNPSQILNVVFYEPKSFREPPLKSYA